MSMPSADFTSHRIAGYARAAIEAGGTGRFDVPLISHIDGNLHVGGCINGVRLPDDFRFVVSLYKWERYALGAGTERFEYEMFDGPEIVEAVRSIAQVVTDCVARGKTLVHCQAGLNRSNLVAALSLIDGGMQPADAVALLRQRRSPVVLCNDVFERWLLTEAVTS